MIELLLGIIVLEMIAVLHDLGAINQNMIKLAGLAREKTRKGE